ncbi:hypothetical protein OWM07_03245 [Deferribacter thermophilus]|uniref:hypothetical protein n=1 Tax=Deferribacter thermophilus TaxID=53573 RepID=UPI003C19248D
MDIKTAIIYGGIFVGGFFFRHWFFGDDNSDEESLFYEKKKEAVKFLRDKLNTNYVIYNNREIYLTNDMNEQDLILAFSCLLNENNRVTNRLDGIVLTALYFPELVSVLRNDADFLAFWKKENEQKQRKLNAKKVVDENFIKEIMKLVDTNKYFEEFEGDTQLNLSKLLIDLKKNFIDKVENELNTYSVDLLTQFDALAQALGFENFAQLLINTIIYENDEKTMYVTVDRNLNTETTEKEKEVNNEQI